MNNFYRIILTILTILSILMLSFYSYAQNRALELLPGMQMPDEDTAQTYGCTLIREYSADKFPQVPGPETTIKIYRCGSQQFAIYQFNNLNIYAVATKNGQQPVEGCLDEDSLGYCTRIVLEDEEFSVDFNAYNIKTKDFNKYDIDVIEVPQVEGLKIPKKPDSFHVGDSESEQ